MKNMLKNDKTKYLIILIIIICLVLLYKYYEKNNNIQIVSEQLNSTNDNVINSNENFSNTNENNINQENIKIIVYVAGEVVNPGVYEMEQNDRIADVIEHAGGLKDEANIKNINLALVLEDGMKVYIPSAKEDENSIISNGELDTNDIISSNTSKNTKNLNSSKVNINIATQAQLESLPGIGPSTANKIVTYRSEHGKFKSIEDIKSVSGIGDSKFAKIKDLITIK